MTYFVYIIYSEGFDIYYIGFTENINRRIAQHNSGFEYYTKRYKPWKLVLTIAKPYRLEARILEKKIKNLNRGRLFLFTKFIITIENCN